jgi:hypothetical protein
VERTRPFKHGLLLKPARHGGRTPELEALRGRTLLIPWRTRRRRRTDEVFYGTVREVYETAGAASCWRAASGREGAAGPVRPRDGPPGRRGGRVLEMDVPPGLLEL